MNFEVTCFKTTFKFYISKICETFAYSKYLFNQNISIDSRNSGELYGSKFFEKVLCNLVKFRKKWQRISQLANINQ